MPDSPDSAQAQVYKEKGNQFYKAGNHLEAIEQYKLATEADPKAPLLFFNLSAAEYEAGYYESCLKSAGNAVSLCDPKIHEELLSKLWLRRAKCQFHLGNNFKGAEDSAKKAAGFRKGPVAIKKDAKAVGEAANVIGFYKELLLEVEVFGMIMDLPKYRPSLCTDIREYYNLGHDTALSQFEPSRFPENESTYAFFFGGIGDARHLYATLIGIADHEEKKDARIHNYHFTINDVKPHVLARNVLIFLLLSQLGKLPQEKTPEEQSKETDILTLLFFVYVGVLIPPRVHSHLMLLINTAKNALLNSNENLPDWLWVSEQDRLIILQVYKSWSTSAGSIVSTQQAQAGISDSGRMAPPSFAPKGCEREHASYKKAGVLWPPVTMRKEHDPRMDSLVTGNESGWEKKLKAIVGKKWKINVTLVDEDWFKRAGVWDVSFDPFRIAEHFYEKSNIPLPKHPKQTYDYFEPFFILAAKAIARLEPRIKVECAIDDINNALEFIHHSPEITHTGHDRPLEFPVKYDRIHLSNIPDYIGGHMSTVLYCLPVLKAEPHAHVTSTCLLNPPLWNSAEDFMSEYLLLPTLSQLEKATLLKLAPGQTGVLLDFLPMCEFINWQKALPPGATKLSYDRLLPRAELNRWLIQVFFHIAIPSEREIHSMARINSPLNLTAFIRLLVRLVEIGYPAHWVGAVVEDILDNKVYTNTRIPDSAPVKAHELTREWPRLSISTKPFIPEMEMLLATWCRVLPFGVVTQTRIPRPEHIFEYKFKLEKPLFRDEFVNVLALVFYPETALEKLLKSASSYASSNSDVMIRDVLAGKGTETPEKKRMRDSVWVVSTFWWDHTKREVRLRAKEGWIENMKREDRWVANLFRTDDWTPCTYPTSLRGGNLAKRAVRWVDLSLHDM